MTISRRTVGFGLGALGVAGPTAVSDFLTRAANAATIRTRHSATSVEGKHMLTLYARAVAKMRDGGLTSERSPQSWTFQWYTHDVPTTTSKSAELSRVFGAGSSPAKTLATDMWGTCMSHSGRPARNFMTWHRAYVLYFEEIVRRLSADEFTLPYWDYTNNAAIPEEFRKKSDPLFKAFYIEERNDGVNAGTPIDQLGLPIPNNLNLDALSETRFLPGSSGVPQGFSAKLDNELHGYVHVSTGNTVNMGRVPFAARDPIFWLHHSNIDRIWAAWNANGGQNPTSASWRNEKFVFGAFDGSRIEVTNGDLVDIAVLGYQYDALPTGPNIVSAAAAQPSEGASEPAEAGPPNVLASTQAAVTLGSRPTKVDLKPTTPDTATALAARPSNVHTRRYLVISNISTNVQPGVLYGVYASSSKAGDNPTGGVFVGSIHFFNAESMGHDMASMQPENAPSFVFDVTELTSKSPDANSLSYYIVAAGQPQGGAEPVVGSMRIIEK